MTALIKRDSMPDSDQLWDIDELAYCEHLNSAELTKVEKYHHVQTCLGGQLAFPQATLLYFFHACFASFQSQA